MELCESYAEFNNIHVPFAPYMFIFDPHGLQTTERFKRTPLLDDQSFCIYILHTWNYGYYYWYDLQLSSG